MAILPRYQRTGITTRQPGNIDFADVREQAKLSQTLSQQLDRMSDFAFKKSAEMAVERGQERVREEGAIPTLQSIEQKGGPRGIAERAAVDAANRIAVVEIETLATQDMQTLTLEADKTNMSMPVYQEKMRDINDGYKASLEVVDPVAAGVLAARLQGSTSSYENRYSEVVFKKAKIAWAENVNTTVTTNAQLMLDSATQPGATEESINAAGKKLYETQITLGVGGKKARKVVDDTLKIAIRQNRVYLFEEAAGIEEKRFLLEQYKAQPLPGVSYETNLGFVTSLEIKLDRKISAAQTDSVNNLTEAMDAMALTGVPPSGFEINEDSIKSIFPPEQADEYIQTWAEASEDAENRGALAHMNAGRIELITQGIEAELRDAEAIGDAGQIKKAKTRETAWLESVAKRNDAIVKDAALFVTNTNKNAAGMVENISDQLSTGRIDQAAEGLLLLREVMDVQFDDLGVPQSLRNVMPKQMAAQVVNMIQGIEPDIAAQTFQLINQSLGEYSPKFIEELRAQGLRPEYVQAMYVSNPAVQKELVDISVMEVSSILEGLPNTTKNDVMIEMNDVLSDYRQAYLAGGDAAKANNIYNQQINTAQKLAFTRLKNGTESEITTAVENALNDLIPEYQQTVIETGGTYVVPMEFDAEVVRINASKLLSETALNALDIKPLDSPLLPDFADRSVSLASLSSTGKFLNNSTGDGLVLHYDINGALIKTEFEIKFSELSDFVKSIYGSPEIIEDDKFLIQQGFDLSPEDAESSSYSDPFLNPLDLGEENK